MEQKVNTRELVTEMLMEIYAGREYSHILLRNVLDKYDYLNENDKAFMKRLTEGTLERGIQIDYVLNSFSKVQVNKMKPFIRSLMRMSVYQILFMDKVPDSAACNEAVKLAQKRKFGTLKGFVNGVLRAVARQKDTISYPDRDKEPLLYLSVQYSMPALVIKLVVDDYGMEQAEQILLGMQADRSVCIRMNETLAPELIEEAVAEWNSKGVIVTRHTWLPYAYLLTNTEKLSRMTGFMNGLYTVQDISSMLVCEIADIRENDRVIDVCAAPGGKTLHAACKLHETGMVDARDVSSYKTDLIMENVNRLHADNVSVKVFDATIKDNDAIESADVMLLDIPCSGLGVIGKKPEIRYRLNEDGLKELETLQKQIIDTVWEYVKPGGTLIYSTCTIRRAENEQMVSYLLSKYPFTLQSIDTYLPEELRSEETKEGKLLLFPTQRNDGFFMARLTREK